MCMWVWALKWLVLAAGICHCNMKAFSPNGTIIVKLFRFLIVLIWANLSSRAMLLIAVVASGLGVNIYWFWLPLIWALGITFIFGLSLITSGLYVYLRDTRYIVESVLLVAFWFMPIFYLVSFVPAQYRNLYVLNPIAALIMAMRSVLLDGQAPATGLMLKFMLISLGTLGLGMLLFRQMKSRFYDYL